jgi:nucleoside-diphosphate-sugar epimerase
MVYGNFDGKAAIESQPCNPIGIYGALKYGAEKLVQAYGQVFDTPYTIIRPSALYGERCVSRRVGQAFIENALQGKQLTINGDGSDALDFTYVQDLISGTLCSIAEPKAINETFNVTYGSSRKIIQLAEMVLEAFPGLSIKFNPRDGLMPERGTLSIEKARNLLGYEPAFPIEAGYLSYIQWYKEFASENPNLFLRS